MQTMVSLIGIATSQIAVTGGNNCALRLRRVHREPGEREAQ